MALTKCKECGREVSASAKTCPHCGIQNPGVTAKAMLVGALAFAALFGGCVTWVVDATAPEILNVTAAEYGERWPLKANSAQLGCQDSGERYVQVDGIRYALNGKSLSAGMERPDSIQKDGEGFKMADFSERAADLCP